MNADVLIAGGGLAGACAAITLARAGRSVILVEREPSPTHKVCGEFLSHEALELLTALGLDVAQLGASPIEYVRLAGAHRAAEARLPFPAASLTRKTLDEALLLLAERTGATLLRGSRIDSLETDGDARNPAGVPSADPPTASWRAQLSTGATLSADTVFLATGKHDLRSHVRPRSRQSDLVGFKMYWRLAPEQTRELERHVELLLYRGGYGGLQLVEDGAANLCCLIDRTHLRRLGGRWQHVLDHMRANSPHLRRRLAGAQPLLERPLAIASIPYGYVSAATEPGLWRLGDQAAVIPSLTGDGMSIALYSGRQAARMYLAGQTAQDFQRHLRGAVATQFRPATAISHAMVHRLAQPLVEFGLRAWPEALTVAARCTRLRTSLA